MISHEGLTFTFSFSSLFLFKFLKLSFDIIWVYMNVGINENVGVVFDVCWLGSNYFLNLFRIDEKS